MRYNNSRLCIIISIASGVVWGSQLEELRKDFYTITKSIVLNEYTFKFRQFSTLLAAQISVYDLIKDNEKIATFQLPTELQARNHNNTASDTNKITADHLPSVSPNNAYILALTAVWGWRYYNSPTNFEWHLFDTKNRKTIKTFPLNPPPKFSQPSVENKTIIFFKSNSPVPNFVISEGGLLSRFFTSLKKIIAQFFSKIY